MKNLHLKNVLLGGASVLAVGIIMGPALAQDQGVETVVVTGIRASLESAQSIKQNSIQVVDSITAVDIGALPDRNVADALQRVPGVTLQRTDQNRDPVRYGGTGNTVYIRGLAWVSNLLNGRDTFSASNGRSLSFADVSADLLSGVDVYKNPDVTMIEGGIGGAVNLRTRKPFDQDGRVIAFTADYTYGDVIHKGKPSGSALFSDRFNTSLGEIGVLVSVDWQDQLNRTNGISTNWYGCLDVTSGNYYNAETAAANDWSTCMSEPAGTKAGDHVNVPNYAGYRQIDWEQQRFAIDSSIQWRPNDKLEITIEGLNSVANPHDTEYAAGISVSTSTSALSGYTFAPDGTWTGGKVEDIGYAFDTRIGKHHDRNTDLSVNAKYTPSEAWEFTVDGDYSESVATNYSLTAYTAPFTGKGDVIFNFDLTGGSPTVNTTTQTFLSGKANYTWLAAMDHMEDNYAHAFAARADATYTVGDSSSWVKSVNFGFRAELKQAITRQTGYNWVALAPAWGGPWGPLFLDNTYDNSWDWGSGTCLSGNWTCFVPANGAPSSQLPNSVVYKSFGSFVGGSVPSAWFVSANLLNKSMAYAYNVLKTAENPYWGWVPFSVQAGCTTVDIKCYAAYSSTNPRSDNQDAGVNNQKENTYAGYLAVNFGHDDILGTGVPIDGNIGVRVISTQDEGDAGKLIVGSINTTCTVGAMTTGGKITTCADYNTATAWTGVNSSGIPLTGTVALPATSNSYTDILPAFNLRAHITDQLQARVAFSQSVVRPLFDYTTNFATVGFTFGSNLLSGTFTAAPNGSTGNVNLKPMQANNYDASLEWYFAPTGSVTFAMFHKDISNYFYTGSVLLPIVNPNTGKSMNFFVTSTLNGGKGKVEGFELAYQQFYDSLPGFWGGFGVQANYTKIYNSGGENPTVNLYETAQVVNAAKPLPMEGMSPDSFNLALLYEKYGVSARFAYNWRSRFLLSSSAANVKQPIWSDNYGQLDGSVLYTIFDHYKFGVQVTNMLKTQTKLEVGYADYHRPYDWINTDRKYSVVLRASW